MQNRQRSASSELNIREAVANDTIAGAISLRFQPLAGQPNLVPPVGQPEDEKSMTRYSVAGVSRVARQVSWASGRRTASTRTLIISC